MWQRLQISNSIEDKKISIIKQSKVCFSNYIINLYLQNYINIYLYFKNIILIYIYKTNYLLKVVL